MPDSWMLRRKLQALESFSFDTQFVDFLLTLVTWASFHHTMTHIQIRRIVGIVLNESLKGDKWCSSSAGVVWEAKGPSQ